MVHYIRQNIDVSKCIIVSPDAGGAKRFVFASFLLTHPRVL